MSITDILSRLSNFNIEDDEDKAVYNFCRAEIRSEKPIDRRAECEALALALDYKLSLVVRRVHAGMPIEKTGGKFEHKLMDKHKEENPHLIKKTKTPL